MSLDSFESFLILKKGMTFKAAKAASLAADGLANHEIGLRLGIAEPTVKFHLAKVFRALRIKSRYGLVKYKESRR